MKDFLIHFDCMITSDESGAAQVKVMELDKHINSSDKLYFLSDKDCPGERILEEAFKRHSHVFIVLPEYARLQKSRFYGAVSSVAYQQQLSLGHLVILDSYQALERVRDTPEGSLIIVDSSAEDFANSRNEPHKHTGRRPISGNNFVRTDDKVAHYLSLMGIDKSVHNYIPILRHLAYKPFLALATEENPITPSTLIATGAQRPSLADLAKLPSEDLVLKVTHGANGNGTIIIPKTKLNEILDVIFSPNIGLLTRTEFDADIKVRALGLSGEPLKQLYNHIAFQDSTAINMTIIQEFIHADTLEIGGRVQPKDSRITLKVTEDHGVFTAECVDFTWCFPLSASPIRNQGQDEIQRGNITSALSEVEAWRDSFHDMTTAEDKKLISSSLEPFIAKLLKTKESQTIQSYCRTLFENKHPLAYDFFMMHLHADTIFHKEDISIAEQYAPELAFFAKIQWIKTVVVACSDLRSLDYFFSDEDFSMLSQWSSLTFPKDEFNRPIMNQINNALFQIIKLSIDSCTQLPGHEEISDKLEQLQALCLTWQTSFQTHFADSIYMKASRLITESPASAPQRQTTDEIAHGFSAFSSGFFGERAPTGTLLKILIFCKLDEKDGSKKNLETALRRLANQGKSEYIAYLVKHYHVDINAASATSAAGSSSIGQRTALHWVAMNAAKQPGQQKWLDCIAALLELGADRNLRDDSGKSAIDYAGTVVIEALVAQHEPKEPSLLTS